MNTDQLGGRRERISVDNPNGGPNKAMILLIIIVLLAAIGTGAYFFMSRNNTDSANSDLTPTSSPTDIPTDAEVDLEAYEIQVLNGTETEGEAGKLRTTLEGIGFKVAGTGNADKSDYTETIIQAKSTVDEAFIGRLREDLEKSYPVSSNSEELEDDNENDVVVIIGMKAKEEDEEATDEAETTEDEADETPTPTESE
jgi:flagellar basal body-associated protein FliL